MVVLEVLTSRIIPTLSLVWDSLPEETKQVRYKPQVMGRGFAKK